MDAFKIGRLQVAIVLLMVSALVLAGVGVPTSVDSTVTSQAWAGGGHHDDDDDDDDRDGRRNNRHKKNFDHFACYTAAEHFVNEEVKIINQFTRDEAGAVVAVPITVGELALLCVPTKKIHLDEHHHHGSHNKPRNH